MALHEPTVTELISFSSSSYPARPQGWERHVHGFYQFDATLGGEVFLDTGGRHAFRSRRGDGVLIPPMVRHGHRTRTGFRVGMFKFRIAPRYWRIFGNRPFAVALSPLARAGVERAGKAWHAHAYLCAPQAVSALTLCLIEAARSMRVRAPREAPAAAPDAFRERLWELLERMERNPYAKWPVSGLAAACHLSPDHFTRCFWQTLRQSPLDYSLHVRMRAAAQELAVDPQLPIKEVAAASGYASVHSFTRAFRRALGVPPGRYRHTPSEL